MEDRELVFEKRFDGNPLPNGDAGASTIVYATVETHPHFSITGYVYQEIREGTVDFDQQADKWDGGKAYEMFTGGCIHKELVQIFPVLETLVPLHLTGPTGLPSNVLNSFRNYRTTLGSIAQEADQSCRNAVTEVFTKIYGIPPAQLDLLFSLKQLDEMEYHEWLVTVMFPIWRSKRKAAIDMLNELLASHDGKDYNIQVK